MKHYIIVFLACMVFDIILSERIWTNPMEALRYRSSSPSSAEDYKKYKKADKITSSISLNLKGNVRRKFAAIAALQHPEKNIICSPISALLPLGELALGAVGVSLKQLQEAIGYSKIDIGKSFKWLLQSFRNLSGITLNIASIIYVSDTTLLKEQYISDVTSSFETGIGKLNFSDSKRAAASINNWVSEKTSGFIQNLISPSQLYPSTSLVLVNAVYFRGYWVHPFEDTSDDTFYGHRGKKLTVQMMQSDEYYNYTISKQLQAQIVEIPYEGNSASLVVVLPLERDGLPVLLHKIKLAPELLEDGLRDMTIRRVLLRIPKFKIETTMDLKPLYEFIGISKIFNGHDSGLSDITQDNSNIFVGVAIQKAMIEVNELGTEAAAASALSVMLAMLIEHKTPPEIFKCDHPFYFFMLAGREALFSGVFASN